MYVIDNCKHGVGITRTIIGYGMLVFHQSLDDVYQFVSLAGSLSQLIICQLQLYAGQTILQVFTQELAIGIKHIQQVSTLLQLCCDKVLQGYAVGLGR